MIKPLEIKRNDLQPYYPFRVPNASSLSGATIVCTMVNTDTGVKKIDRQSAGVYVTDAINSEAEYRWQTGDTDTSGKYKIEFEITPQIGGKFTIPSLKNETAYVVVIDDLDGV